MSKSFAPYFLSLSMSKRPTYHWDAALRSCARSRLFTFRVRHALVGHGCNQQWH